MEKAKLDVFSTIGDGIQIGLKNFVPLFLAALLYVVTIWIPYINVGTTIAMNTIPGRLAHGEVISPLFIFDSKYRKDFSAFFLLIVFIWVVTFMGYMFVIIPGFVVSISMSLATYILVDKDVSPTDAMKLSNNATYGHKWAIFFISLIVSIAVVIAMLVIVWLSVEVFSEVFMLLAFLLLGALAAAFVTGINAVIYRDLFLKPQETVAEEVVIEATVEA